MHKPSTPPPPPTPRSHLPFPLLHPAPSTTPSFTLLLGFDNEKNSPPPPRPSPSLQLSSKLQGPNSSPSELPPSSPAGRNPHLESLPRPPSFPPPLYNSLLLTLLRSFEFRNSAPLRFHYALEGGNFTSGDAKTIPRRRSFGLHLSLNTHTNVSRRRFSWIVRRQPHFVGARTPKPGH